MDLKYGKRHSLHYDHSQINTYKYIHFFIHINSDSVSIYNILQANIMICVDRELEIGILKDEIFFYNKKKLLAEWKYFRQFFFCAK